MGFLHRREPLMKAQLRVVEVQDDSVKEKLRKAAYAAIDQMVEKLPEQISGKDLEAASDVTRIAMRPVSAAVFEQVLMSLGEEQLNAKTCICPQCNATLRSPKNT